MGITCICTNVQYFGTATPTRIGQFVTSGTDVYRRRVLLSFIAINGAQDHQGVQRITDSRRVGGNMKRLTLDDVICPVCCVLLPLDNDGCPECGHQDQLQGESPDSCLFRSNCTTQA